MGNILEREADNILGQETVIFAQISEYIAQHKPVLCSPDCPHCEQGEAHEPPVRCTLAELTDSVGVGVESLDLFADARQQLIAKDEEILAGAPDAVRRIREDLDEGINALKHTMELEFEMIKIQLRIALTRLREAEDEESKEAHLRFIGSRMGRFFVLRVSHQEALDRLSARVEQVPPEFISWLFGHLQLVRERHRALDDAEALTERAIQVAETLIEEDLEWYRDQRERMLNGVPLN
ncbi:hypothetical protein EG329_000541 [Mollisiaceae sp. DMI_Dod_QoI]|nr:hypothetical protein EG329_000541 [Helotiales sp. DMI_Dod_QoI]